MKRVMIFPGQGSQKVGMGKDLADASPVARAVFDEVDDALDQHLFRLMCEGPEEELLLTENAQPAIMAYSLAVARILEKEAQITPATHFAAAAGHSLGEYSALCATGALPLDVTARLLKLRGRAMQAAVPVGEGAMAALLGANLEKAEALAQAAAQGQVCTIANDNDPSQIVISGHRQAIERAAELARDHGIKRAVMLPVSAPFHCPLMRSAADAMAEALADTVITPPAVPVYANVSAAPVDDPEAIRTLLVEQVTGRVRWRESVIAMAGAGHEQFVECAGKVLSPMVKRSAPDAESLSLISMDDIGAFVKSI